MALVESVRCLECGSVYAKPSGGGTVQQNPGCPDCGYLGWLSATVPVSGDLRVPNVRQCSGTLFMSWRGKLIGKVFQADQ